MNNLVWLDLEMSGLDVKKNRILEIAVVVTNTKMEILAQGPNLVIFQPQDHLDAMDEWCTVNHAKTGLSAEVLNSSITEVDAEHEVIDFLSNWVEPGKSPMCGNSIGTDREFIKWHMPSLFTWFHYRNFDVSTLKMVNSWWAKDPAKYEKSAVNQHRAINDILESINEAKFYMNKIYEL